jgi:hypothetical protein
MTISYILEGAGWAKAVIEHDGRRREMRFSWMSDALSRLIDAAIQIAQGARETRFGFTDEPGEHVCVVTRNESDQVMIRVFWYKEWTPPGTRHWRSGVHLLLPGRALLHRDISMWQRVAGRARHGRLQGALGRA